MKTELNKDHEGIKQLIEDVTKKCNDLGVEIILSDEDHVVLSENIKAGGYFSDDTDGEIPTLACAMGQKDFEKAILLFVHESCHLDQWSESDQHDSIWAKGDASVYIDEWLSGEEFPQEELDDIFKTAIELELDCEKRSVEKLKKYNIPTNIEHYIQKANAYVLFYNYLKKHRKWSIPGNPPYGDLIYPHAPNYWLDNYDTIPEELKRAYDKHLGLI